MHLPACSVSNLVNVDENAERRRAGIRCRARLGERDCVGTHPSHALARIVM